MKKWAIDKKCFECGRCFSPSAHDRPKQWGKRKFCSIRCSSKQPNSGKFVRGHIGYKNSGNFKKGLVPWNFGLKGFMAGEKNANWKGGTSSVFSKLRAENGHYGWSRSVLRRDNFTCVECKRRGGNLHAHHIYPFSSYPEYRNELWNGITLCESCHMLIKGREEKFIGFYLSLTQPTNA